MVCGMLGKGSWLCCLSSFDDYVFRLLGILNTTRQQGERALNMRTTFLMTNEGEKGLCFFFCRRLFTFDILARKEMPK